MSLLTEYVIPRLIQWAFVIFIGVSLVFIIPRMSPINPIDQALGRITAFQSMSPEATMALRESLQDLYGLEGSLMSQYLNFWERILQGDLGPSFGAFPRSVNELIASGIWWTVGLLGLSTLIAWVLGLVLGALAAYHPNKWWSRAIENVLVSLYPIPYYIVAFILLILFTYYLPIFPLVGGARGVPEFSFDYIGSILYYGFLPALSLVLGATAFRFIMSKALATTEKASDYVRYAEIAALPKRRIVFRYVARNTMLPQVTDLALSLAAIFEGALITEVVFGYPGLGFLLLNAINASDYNLIMGISLLSVVGIATASLLIDLCYPLIDPRVRYR